MQSSSTNENITSSNGIVYPFPPYIFPFSSSSFSTSSPSSYTNLHHHFHPHQENPLGLHQDQFSLLNNFLQPITENTMLNLGGASSNVIMSSNEDYHQHYVYDDRIDSNISHHHPYLVNKTVKVPPVAAKKDGHSKILTAQGFRDRRVRLSINVARDFFDLQDLLGFDKASKTLEWLLSKSRSDIVDLAKSKCDNDNGNNNITPSLSSSNTTENDGVCDTGNEVKRKKKMKEDVAKLMERALRVKARARARERTIEKKLSSTTSKMCSSHLSLFNMNEELGSALLTKNIHEHVPLSGSSHPDWIRSLELNLQKIEASSNCCSPNNNIQFSSSVSTNWEINGGGGAFAFPSFSTITTNMNLNSNGS